MNFSTNVKPSLIQIKRLKLHSYVQRQRQQRSRYAHASTKICPLGFASDWLVTIIQVQKKKGFLDQQ